MSKKDNKNKWAKMTALDLLIQSNERIEKMQDALKNIFSNTFRTEPSIFRAGVLANIEMAVGKEKYKEWEEFYE